jgi:hypothetical protein
LPWAVQDESRGSPWRPDPQYCDRWQRGPDAQIVQDAALVVHRDVEVDADEDTLAVHVDVANGLRCMEGAAGECAREAREA